MSSWTWFRLINIIHHPAVVLRRCHTTITTATTTTTTTMDPAPAGWPGTESRAMTITGRSSFSVPNTAMHSAAYRRTGTTPSYGLPCGRTLPVRSRTLTRRTQSCSARRQQQQRCRPRPSRLRSRPNQPWMTPSWNHSRPHCSALWRLKPKKAT